MPTHHPPVELLADYANGATSPGVALLIAAHLTYAPESRAMVEAFECVGGTLLADEAPAQMSAAALEKCLRAIGSADRSAPRRAACCKPRGLPRPVSEALAAELGAERPEIPWHFRMPGVSEYRFRSFKPERVSLLRAGPSSGLQRPSHEGTELTLILCGTMREGERLYGPGDLAVSHKAHEHGPRAAGQQTCICLVVMDGHLRFTGRFSHALNLLSG